MSLVFSGKLVKSLVNPLSVRHPKLRIVPLNHVRFLYGCPEEVLFNLRHLNQAKKSPSGFSLVYFFLSLADSSFQ